MKKSLNAKKDTQLVSSSIAKKATMLKCILIAFTAIFSANLSYADVNKKKIGDLEIYKAAEGGYVTIMMMLDTSGSMDEPYMRDGYYNGYWNNPESACNLPNGTTYTPMDGTQVYTSTKSGSTAKFNMYGCTIAGTTKNEVRYFLRNQKTTTATTTVKVYKGTQYRKRTKSWGIWGSWSAIQTGTITYQPTSTSTNTNSTVWFNCETGGSIDKSKCTLPNTSTSTTNMSSETENGIPSTVDGTPVVTTEANYIFTDPNNSSVQYEIQTPTLTTTISTTTTVNQVYWKKTVTVTDKPAEDKLDRLTQLKIAIFKLLDEGGLDPNKISIGVGQYSSQSGSNNVYSSPDNKTGKILVPAALLDDTQIEKIKTAVAALKGTGGTPTANAYAEAGSYMLGTTTKDSSFSGFDYSVTNSKSNGNYISPVKNAKTASCDGRGIYFLTDGSPNSAPNPLTVMKNALGTKGGDFNGAAKTGLNTMPQGTSTTCDPDYYGYCTVPYYYNNGMPQVGAFSQALRYSSQNPNGQSIRTAVVGFGLEFKVNDNTVKLLDKVAVDKATGEPLKTVAANGTVTYTYEKNPDGTNKQAKYYDCNQITGIDAKNACNWGAKSHPSLGSSVGGFGEGGFYSAQSATDVVDSIKNFVDDLNQTLPSTPSGTITVPDDPYRADSQLAIAFYPTLQAEVGKSPATWAGNLKKYSLNEGTLYGKNNNKLFNGIDGSLNPSTEDLWSAVDVANGNNKVTSGGFLSLLKTPVTAVNNVRTLYIEDSTSSTDSKPVLRKFGVNTSGQVTLDDNPISDTNKFVDTTTYTDANVQILLQFLGFSLTDAQKTTAIKDLVLTTPASPTKILGATIHSTPSMVSYSATIDASGKVSDTREDYVLFGSSDGALHLVNADSYPATGAGTEQLAFVPKAILTSQPAALISGQGTATGVPYFGLDAPWLVDATYYYDYDNSRVTVEKCAEDTTNDPSNTRDCRNTHVRAYGGLRMGGEGLYGLDLVDKNNPKALFRIDSSKSGFSRIGQIWSKPTKAKIKTSSGSTEVLVFGGGYDTCYEDENFQVGTTTSTLTNQKGLACNSLTEAQGNAVYIVNATTGELIWSASSSNTDTSSNATNLKVDTMKNSIVGGITALDRNNDGFMDQIYFADLGGQVFRADFTNKDFLKPGATTAEAGFSNTRVVRILQPAYSSSTELKYNHRFYERPVVSFYRGDNTFNNGRLFALINVISGDRSSPLSKLRSDNTYADRLYGIFDTDITLPDSVLYASNFTTATESATSATKIQKTVNLASSDLYAFDTTTNNNLSLVNKQDMIYKLGSTTQPATGIKTKKGWYYPLTRFDGFDKVKYNKGVGRSEVINSFLYTTIYNPDMNYSSTDSCAAKITGGSERQLYCLPYGVCLKVGQDASGNNIDEFSGSKNGTGGFSRAGQGIQELTLGPRSSTRQNQKLLISTITLTERALNRVDFGDDSGKSLIGGTNTAVTGLDSGSQTTATKTSGDRSAAENIFNERYTLLPRTWFEITK